MCMRICENCKKSDIKKIWHPYKDFRCSNCNAEYKYSNNRFDSVSDFIVGFSTEIFLSLGLIFLLTFQTWLVFLVIIVVVPLVSQILKFRYGKIKLTGFYAKLKERDL